MMPTRLWLHAFLVRVETPLGWFIVRLLFLALLLILFSLLAFLFHPLSFLCSFLSNHV